MLLRQPRTLSQRSPDAVAGFGRAGRKWDEKRKYRDEGEGRKGREGDWRKWF